MKENKEGWNAAQIKDLRNLGHLLQAMYGKKGTEAVFDTIQDVADKLEKDPSYHPKP